MSLLRGRHVEGLNHRIRCVHALANAIWNTDAVVGVARQFQARDFLHALFDSTDPGDMPRLVLRHRSPPAVDTLEYGPRLEFYDVLELRAYRAYDLFIGLIQHGLVARAA